MQFSDAILHFLEKAYVFEQTKLSGLSFEYVDKYLQRTLYFWLGVKKFDQSLSAVRVRLPKMLQFCIKLCSASNHQHSRTTNIKFGFHLKNI